MESCIASSAAQAALLRKPADGFDMWYSTYKFTSTSGGLFAATPVSLFQAKQGAIGQGFASSLTFVETNIQIEKQLPYDCLLRRLGFAFPRTVQELDKLLFADLMAVDYKTDGTRDHWLGLLRDWMSLPDFGAAVGEDAAAAERRWVASCCRMRELLMPFELKKGDSFTMDLVPASGGIQSATATAHDFYIYARLEVEPLE